MSRSPGHAIIVGAGLGGALMACSLARAGYRVDVYERRTDPRSAGFRGGRSINLALSTRGIHALEQVGLAERVLADAIPMRGRMMHAVDGTLTYQPYSRRPTDAINSVSRGGLNLTLIEAADEYDDVTLHFDHRAVDVDLATTTMTFDVDGRVVEASADFIIGADGAFSAVRQRLQRTGRFNYSQSYLEHGYKELCIPATDDGGFRMEREALHIWPRGGHMMIALPNADGSFTCTCFWPFDGSAGFASLRSPDDVTAYFREHFGDAVPLMPTLTEDYDANPVGSLVTVRCDPWHVEDRVVLLGDAAHAIVPFFGQGMNCAFEDCTVLAECLAEFPDDRAAAFRTFTERRTIHANAIADMAITNFIEMRDRVGSRAFLLGKKFEKLLHATLPAIYTPLYHMVTFTNIPYDDARVKDRRQRVVLGAALTGIALVVVIVMTLLLARLLS